MTSLVTSKYEIYACLPFIELAREASIQIGPVLFWPSSKFAGKIDVQDEEIFQKYIHSVTHIKAKVESREEEVINKNEATKIYRKR